MNRSHAIIEIDLTFPFKISLEILNDFLNEWGGRHISCGTARSTAVFALDDYKFARIWGELPRIGRWRVPDGAEHFMEDVRVIDVRDFPIK